jgi:hypothetical protein
LAYFQHVLVTYDQGFVIGVLAGDAIEQNADGLADQRGIARTVDIGELHFVTLA